MLTFGELTIVPASQDGKPMSDAECVPTVVQWRLTWMLPRLLPWLAFLAILIWRVGRDIRNLWAAAPVATVLVVTIVARDILSVVSNDILLWFTEALGAAALGLGVVWLLLDVLAVHLRSRLVRLVAMAVILGANGALGMVCAFGAGEFADAVAVAAIFCFATSLVFMIALRIVARTSDRGVNLVGFMVRLAGITSLGPLIVLLPPAFIAYGFFPRLAGMEDILFAIPVISFVFGISISAVAVPFIVLAFLNDTFSARFFACLDLDITRERPPSSRKFGLFRRSHKLGGMM